MARAGITADPPIEPPRPLRPFLRFVRLPDAALVAARRVLDEDAEFRSRVAEAAAEVGADDVVQEMGRGAWLFLDRPDGWEDELAELVDALQASAEAARQAREEQSAVRRLAQAQQAMERAEQDAGKARAEAARAGAELSEERRARRAADERAEVASRRVSAIEEDAARSRREASDAEVEILRWRGEVAKLEGALEAALEKAEATPAFDPAPVHAAIDTAEDALRTVRRAVQEEQARLEAAGADPASAEAEPASDTAPPQTAPPRRLPTPRRQPARLPPAVFEDSVEAAAHLVRVPHVLVLVDGYNAAMSIWPVLAPAEIRARLVDALAELSARTGAEVHVVFDGDDPTGSVARSGARVPVRVTFSPPDVEADDLILAMVDALSPERPVVVASSDRRVQEGARTRGANVVSSGQLGRLLGR